MQLETHTSHKLGCEHASSDVCLLVRRNVAMEEGEGQTDVLPHASAMHTCDAYKFTALDILLHYKKLNICNTLFFEQFNNSNNNNNNSICIVP